MRNGIISLLGLIVVSLLCSHSAHATVGRTQGSFNVSSHGAATYQIPIWVPPGPKGVQPNLALTYNSQSGDGTMGPGWSLSGLSAITRCNATLAQDGAAEAASLTANDKFCLNGNKLRLTSGTYGAASSTYQTELADFSLITAIGAMGDGPASFTVKGKDGFTYEYGNSADSQIKATNATTPYEWLLNKVRDRAGNSYTVTYGVGDAGSQGIGVPVSISYASTSVGAGTYTYKVVLGYGPDSEAGTDSGYVAGGAMVDSNLLTSISITRVDNGAALRKYALIYESQQSPATRKYRLASVKECSDAALTDCLAPTMMAYQDGQSGSPGQQWIYASNVGYAPSGIYPATKFDFNGDGRSDFGSYENGIWMVRFAISSGYSAPISTGANTNGDYYGMARMGDVLGNGQDGLFSNVGSIWWYYSWNGSSFVGVSTGAPVEAGETYLVDMNGDGRADIIRYDDSTHVISVRLNTSVGTTPSYETTVSNTNFCDGGPGHCALMTATTGNGGGAKRQASQRKYDFNGDGREDLIWQYWNDSGYKEWGVFLSTGTSVEYIKFNPALTGQYFYPYVGKYNDDVCDDIAGSNTNSSTRVIYSACNGSGVSNYLSYINYSIIGVLDWNSDGRTDLFLGAYQLWGSTFPVWQSTGGGFEDGSNPNVLDETGGGASGYFFPFDGDGDGLDDLGYMYYGASAIYYQPHNGAGIQPDLLISVTDGYGVTHSPSYVSIAQSNYTKGTGAIYPERDIQTPMYVVSQVVASDGIGGTYTQTYNYTGAREDNQGRGFLGFQSRTVTDSRADAPKIVTYYKTAFPYTGMVYQEDVYQHDGTTLISRTVNTPSLNTLDGTLNSQRYFPYVASITVESREVGGAKNGQLIATTSKSFAYDGYGNATSVSTTVTDKDSTSPYFNQAWTTTVTSSFFPNENNWCLGLPWQIVMSNSANNGEPSVSRTATYSIDYANCRPMQQQLGAGITAYRVTTDYGYDDDAGNPQPDFGNLTSVAVTGYGMATRTTSMEWTTASRTTGQFPMKVTNAEGHVTQLDYDFNKGLVSSQIDPNGVQTTWQYDSFGRKTLETRPDNTSTLWTYSFYAAAPITEYVQVTEQLRDTSGAAIRTNTYRFDIFERPTVQVQQLVAGNSSATIRSYNSLGQVQYDYFPYDTAGGSNGYSTFTYDALNRVTQVQRPISTNNSALQTTTFQYLGRTTVTTDAEGKQTTKITDINGWLRRSQDHNGYYQAFGYDAIGSLKSVTDSQSNTLFQANYVYGAQAFQTSTTDMDLGSWGYTPNALGEVVAYTDNKGISFTASFDKLSRPLTRTEPGNSTTWIWGTSPANHNIGQLQTVSSTAGTTETYSYDGIGRSSQRDITADGTTYAYNTTYNSLGQPDTLTYPTSTSGYRLKLQYQYQAGLLRQVKDYNASTVFWQANAMNPRGQITQEQLGNGLVANKAYDAVTGLISSIQCGVGGGACSQNQSYLWDKVGNLTQRQNNNLGLTENFYYDNVHRLDYSQLNGVTNLDMSYDALGNITNRTDVANNTTWQYDAAHKHQVLQAGSGNTYSYDQNGNVTARNGNSINWTSYNYPSQITGAGETISLYYDANRQRYKQVYSGNGNTETTLYIGGLMQKVSAGGIDDYRYTISAQGQTIAIMSRSSSGTNATRYMLNDYQGSVAKFTDSSGNAIVSESFTAFGARRNPQTWSGQPTYGDQTTIANIAREGYTGHTALGTLGLNHMNGRVQDAITGRFLSADPYITEPGNTQNYNRYSYVLNNPMSFVDPSGFDYCPDYGGGYDACGGGGARCTVCSDSQGTVYYFTTGSSFGGAASGDGYVGSDGSWNLPMFTNGLSLNTFSYSLNYSALFNQLGMPSLPSSDGGSTATLDEVVVTAATPKALARRFQQCLAGASGSKTSGNNSLSSFLNGAGTATTAAEGGAATLLAASATNAGRLMSGGTRFGAPVPTNAQFAQLGSSVQSGLARTVPLIQNAGKTIGALAVFNAGYQGYQSSGVSGAAFATGYAMTDFGVESALSSTGLGALAAIAYSQLGGSRAAVSALQLSGAVSACNAAVYGAAPAF